MFDYGIKFWSRDDFVIEDGKVKLEENRDIAIIDIVRKIRDDGYRGPLLIRFPHLIKKQLNKLFSSFKSSIKQYKYKGAFKAVFPLKVNQFPNFVLPLVEASIDKDYGLEAGSKAELIVAMAYTNLGSPIKTKK